MQDDQLQADADARLVALLSTRDSVPEWPGAMSPPRPIRLGVQLPIEHQARQAIAAGAAKLIVHVEAPRPELLRALDRLSRETAVAVAFVSDGPALARQIDAADRVLLIAERMILPRDAIEDLVRAPAPALLAAPNEPSCAHLERIDATHVWAGALLLPAETILSTVDMLGEWDLVLTLLRRAVQNDARRIALPAELASTGLLTRLADQAEADRALDALAARGGGTSGLDLLSAALAPVRRWIVVELSRHQVDPAWFGIAAALFSLAAVAAANLLWPIIALSLALLGEVALGLGMAGAQLILQRRPAPWLRVLVKGASLAVLAIIGGRLTAGAPLALSGVLLPLGWIAIMALADERSRGVAPPGGRWTRLTTAMALLLAFAATLLGRVDEVFVLLALSAFGTAAVRLLAAGEKRI